MFKKFGISTLILCFGLSSVNVGLADQVINLSPVVVQPYSVQSLNQQVTGLDRKNRDEEIAIKTIIEQNDKLTQTTLARQEDAGLAQVNQTMLNYRDALTERDRARILANAEHWGNSRYGDLIALTEDADDMTVHRELVDKSGLLTEKYQMLTQLKDEMTALNEKLMNRENEKLDQRDATIDGFKKLAGQQQVRIQQLVVSLGEMDKKILQLNDIIAEKDRQITHLKYDLARAQSDAADKDDLIRQQKAQIDLLQASPTPNIVVNNQQQSAVPVVKNKLALPPIIVNGSSNQRQPAVNTDAGSIMDKDHNIELPPIIVNSTGTQQAQEATELAPVKKYTNEKEEVAALRNRLHKLSLDLNAKDESIRWLNQVLAAARNKAEYYKLGMQLHRSPTYQAPIDTGLQPIQSIQQSPMKNDLMRLARQLIGLQNQEASLLDEKGNLALRGGVLLDKHVYAYEKKIKELLANRRLQDTELHEQMIELKDDLSQKQQDVDLLKRELEEKIANQKNQEQLVMKIQDLKAQLEDKENQVTSLREEIRSGRNAQDQVGTFKQQLADDQNSIELLKQELENKTAESSKMTLMMNGYQRKLEAKDNAYNLQLAQLKSKEAQVERIRMEMRELQKSFNTKDRDLQTNDLNLSMMQQKAMDERVNEYKDKINGLQADSDKQAEEIKALKTELALSQQQLQGMPSSDEIIFLRSGLKKATMELKQKNEMILQIKTDAQEYEKEFKAQTDQFQSLKEQLQDAYDQLNHRNEDLKYKDLEVVRLKERFVITQGDLQDQIKTLNRKVAADEKELLGKTQGIKGDDLQMKLRNANLQIRDLQYQLDQVKSLPKNAASVNQYETEFREQTRQLQTLKEQFLDAQQAIDRRNEDLKYRDMAITRLKEISRKKENDLKNQVALLTRQIKAAGKQPMMMPDTSQVNTTADNRVEDLQAQLKAANVKMQALQDQIEQLNTVSESGPAGAKLKQALDKMNEQGRMINVLSQKLLECGQSVDFSKDTDKQ